MSSCAWTLLPISVTTRQDAAGVMMGRQMLLVGGQSHEKDESSSSADDHCRDLALTECLDLDLCRRFKQADLSQPRTGCVAASIHGVVAVVGGWNDKVGALQSVEIWMPSERRWTPADNMPGKRYMAASATLPSDNLLFVIGGRNDQGEVLRTADVGDAGLFENELVWKKIVEPMSEPRLGAAAVMLAPLRKILVMGGFNEVEWLKSCEVYEAPKGDIHKGKWSSFSSEMPEAVRFGRAVYVEHEGKGYVLVAGGNSSGSGTLQCLDVAAEKWVWSRRMEVPELEGCAMASLDTKLYVVEGGGPARKQRRVFSCDLNREFFQAGPAEAMYGIPPTDKRFPVTSWDATELPQTEDKDINFKGQACKYTGQTLKRQVTPHGVGKVKFSKDSFYLGTFRSGTNHGMGEFYLKSQNWRYVGGFENGEFSGYGFFQTASMEYFGCFEGGQMSGFGRCTFKRDGRRILYTGEWKGDHAFGDGTVIEYGTGRLLWSGRFEEGIAIDSDGRFRDFYTGEVRPKEKFQSMHKIGYFD